MEHKWPPSAYLGHEVMKVCIYREVRCCCFVNFGLATPYPTSASMCYADSNYNNALVFHETIENYSKISS